ncbi:hypothetical protein GCM10022235_69520 [Kribbella ginsengisoli]|uniref:Uncharacterized protein n=1 Tax=Kribbella ginsengisoli TaxID=363865 RepID=A0ABP6YV59_9ACTN
MDGIARVTFAAGFTGGATGVVAVGEGVDGLAEGVVGPSGIELDGVMVGGEFVVRGGVSAQLTRAAASNAAAAHRPIIVGT